MQVWNGKNCVGLFLDGWTHSSSGTLNTHGCARKTQRRVQSHFCHILYLFTLSIYSLFNSKFSLYIFYNFNNYCCLMTRYVSIFFLFFLNLFLFSSSQEEKWRFGRRIILSFWFLTNIFLMSGGSGARKLNKAKI